MVLLSSFIFLFSFHDSHGQQLRSPRRPRKEFWGASSHMTFYDGSGIEEMNKRLGNSILLPQKSEYGRASGYTLNYGLTIPESLAFIDIGATLFSLPLTATSTIDPLFRMNSSLTWIQIHGGLGYRLIPLQRPHSKKRPVHFSPVAHGGLGYIAHNLNLQHPQENTYIEYTSQGFFVSGQIGGRLVYMPPQLIPKKEINLFIQADYALSYRIYENSSVKSFMLNSYDLMAQKSLLNVSDLTSGLWKYYRFSAGIGLWM